MNSPHRDPAWSRLQWELFDKTMSKSAVARTEPAERKTIEMDKLEVVSTQSKQEQERQPANPDQMELKSGPSQADECGPRRSHTESESAAPRAGKGGLRRSQRISKLPSRFKDYIM